MIRRKPKTDLPKIARLQKMSKGELATWGEQCLIYSCQAFDNWRYRDGSIAEVLQAAEPFHEILKEIASRDISK